MFIRILWFLIATWLIAGLLRLLLGGLRRTRRPSDAELREPRGRRKPDLPYSRDQIVDAKFTEVDDESPASSERK